MRIAVFLLLVSLLGVGVVQLQAQDQEPATWQEGWRQTQERCSRLETRLAELEKAFSRGAEPDTGVAPEPLDPASASLGVLTSKQGIKIEILDAQVRVVPLHELMGGGEGVSQQAYLVVRCRLTNTNADFIWNTKALGLGVFCQDGLGNELESRQRIEDRYVDSRRLGETKAKDSMRQGDSYIDVRVFERPAARAPFVEARVGLGQFMFRPDDMVGTVRIPAARISSK